MATITVNRPDWYPPGATVGLYYAVAGFDTPVGAAVDTQTVASDGLLTFTGVADGRRFMLFATVNGQPRPLWHTTPPPTVTPTGDKGPPGDKGQVGDKGPPGDAGSGAGLPATTVQGAVPLYDTVAGGYIAERQNPDPANDSIVHVSPKSGDDADDGASWGRAYKTLGGALAVRGNGRTYLLGGTGIDNGTAIGNHHVIVTGIGADLSRGAGFKATGASAVLSGSLTTGAITTITSTGLTGLGFPTAGVLRIDDELFTYTGLSGATFTGVARAQYGTTAATHAGNAAIAWTSVLTAPMTAADTTLIMESTAMLPTPGKTGGAPTRVRIGLEIIEYTGKTATTLTGLTRGVDKTPKMTHATGDMVTDASILILITGSGDNKLEKIRTQGQANFTGVHVRNVGASNTIIRDLEQGNPLNASVPSTFLTPYGGTFLELQQGEGFSLDGWRCGEAFMGMHIGGESAVHTFRNLGWGNCRIDVLNDGAVLHDNGWSSTVGAAGVTDTATTIPLVSTFALAIDKLTGYGVVVVEGEMIAFTGMTGTSITGCIRGINGTTAVAHAAGVTVHWRTGLTSGGHSFMRQKGVTSNTPLATTVSGAVDATQTTITLASTRGMMAPGFIRVDNEIIPYGNVVGSTITGCRRVWNAGTHSDGATATVGAVWDWRGDTSVFQYSDFDEGNPGSTSILAGHSNVLIGATTAPQTTLFVLGNYNKFDNPNFLSAARNVGTANLYIGLQGSIIDLGTDAVFDNPRGTVVYSYSSKRHRNHRTHHKRSRVINNWRGFVAAEECDVTTIDVPGPLTAMTDNGHMTIIYAGFGVTFDALRFEMTTQGSGATGNARVGIYTLNDDFATTGMLVDVGDIGIGATPLPGGPQIVVKTLAAPITPNTEHVGVLFFTRQGVGATPNPAFRAYTARAGAEGLFGRSGADFLGTGALMGRRYTIPEGAAPATPVAGSYTSVFAACQLRRSA